jgi:methionyl aminopeptidase
MILKSQKHIDAMQEGGKVLAAILRELAQMAKPGMTTHQLDVRARELIEHHDVESSFLGYVVGGLAYPAVLCTSLNEETVHAIPSDRILQEGDLLKLDFGVIHKGLHTDSAVTVLVSDDPKAKQYKDKLALMRVTREALYAGIAAARPGNTVGHIGAAIQDVVEKNKLAIVKELGGHGIGTTLHEDPFVANYGEDGEGDELVPGMALALEPIVSNGGWKIKDGEDGFGYVTKDGSLAAHFEHTIIITEKAPIIVTE